MLLYILYMQLVMLKPAMKLLIPAPLRVESNLEVHFKGKIHPKTECTLCYRKDLTVELNIYI